MTWRTRQGKAQCWFHCPTVVPSIKPMVNPMVSLLLFNANYIETWCVGSTGPSHAKNHTDLKRCCPSGACMRLIQFCRWKLVIVPFIFLLQLHCPLTWVFTPSTVFPLKVTETEKTKDTPGRSTATCVISFLEEPPTYLRQRKLAWHPPSPRQDGISRNHITKGTMPQVAKWGRCKMW